MKRPKLLVCLPTDDNDYQCLQATDAQQIAELVDVDIDGIYADNSAAEQSVKLAKIVQSNAAERPSAIIVEPVGTSPSEPGWCRWRRGRHPAWAGLYSIAT